MVQLSMLVSALKLRSARGGNAGTGACPVSGCPFEGRNTPAASCRLAATESESYEEWIEPPQPKGRCELGGSRSPVPNLGLGWGSSWTRGAVASRRRNKCNESAQ